MGGPGTEKQRSGTDGGWLKPCVARVARDVERQAVKPDSVAGPS